MNTAIDFIIASTFIISIVVLYILQDTIGESLFGGVNCNPKG